MPRTLAAIRPFRLYSKCSPAPASTNPAGKFRRSRETILPRTTLEYQRSMMPDEIKIGVESWGPTAAQVAEATRAVMGHPQMGRFLANSRTQILSSILLDHPEKSAEPVPPNRLRTTIYDYAQNRTLVVN